MRRIWESRARRPQDDAWSPGAAKPETALHPLAGILIGLAVGLGAAAPVAWWFLKRAEHRARRSERRARAAEHLAYVGTMTGGLAHEIRNPLSTLNLNLQLLREDLDRPGRPADPRTLSRLRTIEQEGRRLQEILDSFLKFAGKMEVHLEPQSINDLLEEVAEFYADRLERAGVRLRLDLAENLPEVALDQQLIRQAFANLLLNAEAAMPDGGELMIGSRRSGRGVCLQVTDTGVGIPPEHLDKIFRPYYSTRENGTGLGLPTVRRIVLEHAGEIEVHSEPGRGTRFTIQLPAARDLQEDVASDA